MRQHRGLDSQTAFDQASRTVDAATPEWATGAIFYWRISATDGTTPAADCKLQGVDATSSQAFDLPGAAFGQKSGDSFQSLVVNVLATPVTTGDHRAARSPLPDLLRVAFTFDRGDADETYTYTLSVDYHS